MEVAIDYFGNEVRVVVKVYTATKSDVLAGGSHENVNAANKITNSNFFILFKWI